MRIPFALFFLSLLLMGPPTQAQNTGVTIPVNSPAVRFSPGNWAGDRGRGGAAYRVTWNSGAYCAFTWSTTSAGPSATLNIRNPTSGSAVCYFIDGRLVYNAAVPVSGGLAISGLAGSGAHSLIVYTSSSQQTERWNRGNAFTIAGLTVDGQSTPGTASAARPWVEIVGDSITEGIGTDSNLQDYSFLVGQGLLRAGFDYDVSACGYSGWVRPGDGGGDVPACYAVSGSVGGSGGVYQDSASRWNKIDGVTSLLDSRGHLSGYGGVGQEPSAILINYVVNETLSGSRPSDVQASVTQGMAALRRAAPNAWIFILVPPGLHNTQVYPTGPAYVSTLLAGLRAYRATHPRDSRVIGIDLGLEVSNALASPAYGGGVHPNAAGHAFLAPLILQAMLKYLRPASASAVRPANP